MSHAPRIMNVRFSDLTPTHQYRLKSRGITEKEYNMRGHLDNSWRDRARCRGVDADVFIPDLNVLNDPRAKIRLKNFVENAVSHCEGCPVKQECLEYGRSTHSHGVFGGVLLRPRKRLK